MAAPIRAQRHSWHRRCPAQPMAASASSPATSTKILPGTGRGTVRRSRMVEGARHHRSDGTEPLAGIYDLPPLRKKLSSAKFLDPLAERVQSLAGLEEGFEAGQDQRPARGNAGAHVRLVEIRMSHDQARFLADFTHF